MTMKLANLLLVVGTGDIQDNTFPSGEGGEGPAAPPPLTALPPLPLLPPSPPPHLLLTLPLLQLIHDGNVSGTGHLAQGFVTAITFF